MRLAFIPLILDLVDSDEYVFDLIVSKIMSFLFVFGGRIMFRSEMHLDGTRAQR